MALGRELVRNLEFDARGATIERWLAHHLAELMVQAETATGPAKAEAEARAADLILRIWARRRDLPATADPLGGYREAIAVLSRMMPASNPWAAFTRHGGREQVLHDLFDCMARVVVGGLVLTLANTPRQMAPAEEAAMEQAEFTLREHLDWWGNAVRPDPPAIHRRSIQASDPIDGVTEEAGMPPVAALDDAEDRGTDAGRNEDDAEEREGEEEKDGEQEDVSDLDRRARQAVTACLEHLQEDLAKLVERWKATLPDG